MTSACSVYTALQCVYCRPTSPNTLQAEADFSKRNRPGSTAAEFSSRPTPNEADFAGIPRNDMEKSASPTGEVGR